jgi:hypothetical protein
VACPRKSIAIPNAQKIIVLEGLSLKQDLRCESIMAVSSPKRIVLAAWLLLGPGCTFVAPGIATVTYYDYGAALPVIRPLDAYAINLIVEDLRPDILSRKKIPLYVGVAENGWGETRDVFNRDDCPVPVSVHRLPHCNSLAESIALRLKSPVSHPDASQVRGLMTVEIKAWSTQAGLDLRLDYDLELYLRAPSGERLALSHIEGHGELIDTGDIGRMGFANHVAKEEQLSAIVSKALDTKLGDLLKGDVQNALFRFR